MISCVGDWSCLMQLRRKAFFVLLYESNQQHLVTLFAPFMILSCMSSSTEHFSKSMAVSLQAHSLIHRVISEAITEQKAVVIYMKMLHLLSGSSPADLLWSIPTQINEQPVHKSMYFSYIYKDPLHKIPKMLLHPFIIIFPNR